MSSLQYPNDALAKQAMCHGMPAAECAQSQSRQQGYHACREMHQAAINLCARIDAMHRIDGSCGID
jgi:hypothetical protein